MNTAALILVRKHFASDLVPREINRANARKWVASVRRLGDRWVLRGGEARWGYSQNDRSAA